MKIIYDETTGEVLSYAQGCVADIETMPNLEFREGYNSEYAYDVENATVYTKFTERPKTEIEQAKEKIGVLEDDSATLLNAVAELYELMLANQA